MADEPARMELTSYLSERARKYAGYATAILANGVPHPQLWESARQRMADLVRQFDRGEQLGGTRFIHGDFCFRNILARRDGQRWRISGLIDFEKASLAADPLEDIGRMLLYSVYWNREHVRALCQAYHLTEAARTVERLEFHLLGFGLEVATWAHDQDPRHFDDVSKIIGDIVANPGAWLPQTHSVTGPPPHS
jgi:aminoglycoside phosphotransferase (APT) family kinase protein